MSGLGVTALAEHRPAQAEHARVARAVGLVAIGAVLGHRGVLPDERTAGLRMALPAGVVHRLARHLQLRGGAVRAVTGAAVHLALVQRMGVGLLRRDLLGAVAVVAHLRLGGSGEHRVVRLVRAVAVRTGHLVGVMGRAVPGHGDRGLVAAQAHGVLLLHRRGLLVRAEVDHRRARVAPAHAAGVLAARAVTGLALELVVPERAALVGGHAVGRAKHPQGLLVAVTPETGIGAVAAVFGFGAGLVLRGR